MKTKFKQKIEDIRENYLGNNDIDERQDKNEEEELEKVDDKVRKQKLKNKKKELKKLKDNEKSQSTGSML